jgi:DNA-binding MarR family transcriptional regulator
MARHLNYNPGRDSVDYLEAINSGENRLHILDQILIALRGEIGRPNHQHHLLIGPRGAGKTHLLRILTAGRIPADMELANAYLPVVMPEETTLRTPGDLFLKFVERLTEQLKDPSCNLPKEAARTAQGLCLSALTTAKGMRDPLERLELMAGTLESIAKTLNRILLPIAENMDQTFYLGAQRGRKGPLDEQWAIRRHLQESSNLLIIGAAPSIFGAVGDPGKPFYDFFRTHNLSELSNDEVLEIIRKRLDYEADNPSTDEMRSARVRCLIEHFTENSPKMRGILVITGGLPRFIHLIYEVFVETDLSRIFDTLNMFLDDLTPYFQGRLDSRLIPQPEIDLLHTLALARGPLQPSELARELYGVSTNEVSELLSRLQERGLVKRAGWPGGKAVTWDLTEPLFRVWTQFRDNPEGKDLYRMLGKVVALLFTLPEIQTERESIAKAIASMPASSVMRNGMLERDKLLEHAVFFHLERVQSQELTEELSIPLPSESVHATNARELFQLLSDALKNGDSNQTRAMLEELRALNQVNPKDSIVREMFSMGLVNSIDAAGKAGNMVECHTMLDELRVINQTNPDDFSIREKLAAGLVNVIYASGIAGSINESRAILEELRTLYQANLDDSAMREKLAMGLVNSINSVDEAGSIDGGRAMLEELRTLKQANPDDSAVREKLAMGLVNFIIATVKAGSMDECRALLEELRVLNQADPNDYAIREKLAKGLFNTINAAIKAGNIDETHAMLEELRALNQANSDDSPVREMLAKSLVNSINVTSNIENFEECRIMLEELRVLNQTNPDDFAMREMRAAGLVNAIHAAWKSANLDESRAMLEELRILNQTNPDDFAIRNMFAKGLFNTIYSAEKVGNVEVCNAVIDELRSLNQSNPEDSSVRAELAKSLFNLVYSAVEKGNKDQHRALLEELHALNQATPGDFSVREMLAKSLVNSINSADKAGDLEECRVFLEGLRALHQMYPDDASIGNNLVFGIANLIATAGINENYDLGFALLDELRQLYRTNQNGISLREGMARGLVNAIICAGIEMNREKGLELLAELRSLYQSYPKDSVLHEGFARGLVNCIIIAVRSNKLDDMLITELRHIHQAQPDVAPVREQFTIGLLRAFNFTQNKGENERSKALLEDLLSLVSNYPDEFVIENSLRATFTYCNSLIILMKSGNANSARDGIKWLNVRVPTSMADLVSLTTLALDVLEKGEEQALAREPEEVRRVVRLLLEQKE